MRKKKTKIIETTTCEHYSKPMGWRPLLNKESSLPLQAKNNSNKESAEWGRWTKRVPRQGQMSQKNKIPIATCHCLRFLSVTAGVVHFFLRMSWRGT